MLRRVCRDGRFARMLTDPPRLPPELTWGRIARSRWCETRRALPGWQRRHTSKRRSRKVPPSHARSRWHRAGIQNEAGDLSQGDVERTNPVVVTSDRRLQQTCHVTFCEEKYGQRQQTTWPCLVFVLLAGFLHPHLVIAMPQTTTHIAKCKKEEKRAFVFSFFLCWFFGK